MRKKTCCRYALLLAVAASGMNASNVCVASVADAADTKAADPDIADFSLEQLSDIVITSVSRQEERLNKAAASLFIISANDIKRSGARSLPEALRLAPNLEVAGVDARNYAITARGFNNPFENKLLVLIDGRSVYSPLFSGVFWDAQDVVMEDIERIEVISGAGATIWGANAVNGVINVITRSSKDTQGGLFSAVGGEHERDGTMRYGGKLPNGGYYRIYAKYAEEDPTLTAAGANTDTGWRRNQAGFRMDWDSDKGSVTASGDAYQGSLEQLGTRNIETSGANLIGKLVSRNADDSELRLQAIIDHTERNQPGAFAERLDTLDLDAQQGVRVGDRHNVIWGGGYRYSMDRVDNGPAFAFLPGSLNMHWGNVFVQDEMTIHEGVRLTAGFKVEHNNYTGAEKLPNLRLAWTPDASQLIWGSISRAVRVPSRIDRDFFSPTNPPVVGGVPQYLIAGGPDFVSETAQVAEVGYRAQPLPQFSYSVTAFYSDYNNLRTLEPGPNSSFVFSNLGRGRTQGVEMWGRWQVNPAWLLNGGLVVQSVKTVLKEGSQDIVGASGLANNDPSRHWSLRSSHLLSERMQLELNLRYVSSLPQPVVPAYYEMDMQWLWKVRPDIDIALIGQNLLHPSHAEFGALPGRSVYPRSVLLKMAFRF